LTRNRIYAYNNLLHLLSSFGNFHTDENTSAGAEAPVRVTMIKKAKAKLKKSPAKLKITQVIRRRAPEVETAPRRESANDDLRLDPRFAQAVQNYEAGVKAMQEHKYERAKSLLEKVCESGMRELADRASTHLNTCMQQLGKGSSSAFKTAEEHYDFAVSLINDGNFDDARSHLEKILRQNPKADYAHYGMAALECLIGRFEPALKSLNDAIRLNPANRFQARNDSDFDRLSDDPRFTEVVYPEIEPEPEIETVIRKKK
jgi:tetratricopeptide (TPR) repeat protein